MGSRKPPTKHLPARRVGAVTKAACGLKAPARWTRVPAEVTCKVCIKTVAMAVAEKEFYSTRGKGAW